MFVPFIIWLSQQQGDGVLHECMCIRGLSNLGGIAVHSSTALWYFFWHMFASKIFGRSNNTLTTTTSKMMCTTFELLKLQHLLWFWLLHFANPLTLLLLYSSLLLQFCL